MSDLGQDLTQVGHGSSKNNAYPDVMHPISSSNQTSAEDARCLNILSFKFQIKSFMY